MSLTWSGLIKRLLVRESTRRLQPTVLVAARMNLEVGAARRPERRPRAGEAALVDRADQATDTQVLARAAKETGHLPTPERLLELEELALDLRRDIIDMIYEAGNGHPGGSLGIIDVMTCLYWEHMKHDPSNPKWEKRDRIVMTKRH